MESRLRLDVHRQPDDRTCGPTSLHAVYRFHGDDISLEQVIREVPQLEGGGTLGVRLANHALRRGYGATLYTCNLDLFDPTWFRDGDVDLASKLRAQARFKRGRRMREATKDYLEFLALGGHLCFEDLTADLLRRPLRRRKPVLVGLSATWLYRCARERGDDSLRDDDVRGVPTGHFVVLSGYHPGDATVEIADPLGENQRFGSAKYDVDIHHVVCAVLLGVITYDGNLLVLDPPEATARTP
jgi:hypothetical protein